MIQVVLVSIKRQSTSTWKSVTAAQEYFLGNKSMDFLKHYNNTSKPIRLLIYFGIPQLSFDYCNFSLNLPVVYRPEQAKWC